MSPSAIATRVRLVDAPARQLLAITALVPVSGGLAHVELMPGGRVRFASAAVAGELVLPDAEIARPIGLPAAVLRQIARRHRDAERIAADLLPSGMVVWRSLSEAAAVAIQAEPIEPLIPELPAAPAAPAGAVLLAPGLLQRALSAAATLGADPVLVQLHGGTGSLGAELALPDGGRLVLARSVEAKR